MSIAEQRISSSDEAVKRFINILIKVGTARKNCAKIEAR